MTNEISLAYLSTGLVCAITNCHTLHMEELPCADNKQWHKTPWLVLTWGVAGNVCNGARQRMNFAPHPALDGLGPQVENVQGTVVGP